MAEWYHRDDESKKDHIVIIDKKSKDLEKIKSGEKTMFAYGAAGKKLPHGRVNNGELLYLVEKGTGSIIVGTVVVKESINTEKLASEESVNMIDKNMNKLKLSKEQYDKVAGKKVLCLIEFQDYKDIEPFVYERTNNMDNWIMVDDINTLRK